MRSAVTFCHSVREPVTLGLYYLGCMTDWMNGGAGKPRRINIWGSVEGHGLMDELRCSGKGIEFKEKKKQ